MCTNTTQTNNTNPKVGHALVEQRILVSLDHPFLLKVRFANQTRDKLYLVTDYCQGGMSAFV